MANYNAMHRSTEAELSDQDSLEEFLKHSDYHIDGNVTVDNGTVVISSTSTTFDVWADPGYQEQATEMFLRELANFLSEPMIIRNIGHTKARHVPDAYQYEVLPDGTVNTRSLPDARELEEEAAEPV